MSKEKIFEPYGCSQMESFDDAEWLKQQAWNDYQSWKDNELHWSEIDAMVDAAVEWEVRCA